MEPRILARIESWALEVISRVKDALKVEDSRIELKREWPKAERAARLLGAHANAALGNEILWIIGLDESQGIVGANPTELSNWWSKMQSEFDGISPSLTDVAIQIDGKCLWALAFDTSRAPYVVRNPLYGKPGGGPISLEVPWREGTAARSATRNDLLRLLIPVSRIPDVELLDGSATLEKDTSYPKPKDAVQLHLSITLYLTPRGDSPIVIPFHRCSCRFADAQNANELTDFQISIGTPYTHGGPGQSFRVDSINIERTNSEAIIHGPGKCYLRADANLTATPEWALQTDVSLSFRLSVIDCPFPVLINTIATQTISSGSGNTLSSWKITPVPDVRKESL